MNYKNVERVLLTAVKEDDLHKASKELEIKRWCITYQTLLREWDRTIIPPFLKEILENETCWQIPIGDTSGQVKLNRYTVGRELLTLKFEGGQKNLLDSFDRYRIACWCCFEEEIRSIFEEFKSTLGNKLVESLIKGCDKGALMIYWSHAINNQEDQLELNNDHSYVYAFRCAMVEKHVEALEFFWNKLQSIDSVSSERKEDLLMEAAYNKGHFSTDDVGMVDFCLRELHEDKFHELLKRDREQNKYHYTLNTLIGSYSFESAKKLFEHLKPECLSPEKYSVLMFAALDSIVSAPGDNFVKSGSDMVTSMWNLSGFETHRQHYLHQLSAQYSSTRDLVASLVEKGKAAKVLSKIINSLSQEQMQFIMEEDKSIHEIFTRIRDRQLDSGAGDSQLPSSSLDVKSVKQKVTDIRSKV